MASDPTDRPSAAEFRDRLASLPLGPAPDEAEESRAATGAAAQGRAAGRAQELGRLAPMPVTADGDEVENAAAADLGPGRGARDHPHCLAGGGSGEPAPAHGRFRAACDDPDHLPAPSSEIAVPASFRDCSMELGPDTYCTPTPECWGGVVSMADSSYLIERFACREQHLHQPSPPGSSTSCRSVSRRSRPTPGGRRSAADRSSPMLVDRG